MKPIRTITERAIYTFNGDKVDNVKYVIKIYKREFMDPIEALKSQMGKPKGNKVAIININILLSLYYKQYLSSDVMININDDLADEIISKIVKDGDIFYLNKFFDKYGKKYIKKYITHVCNFSNIETLKIVLEKFNNEIIIDNCLAEKIISKIIKDDDILYFNTFFDKYGKKYLEECVKYVCEFNNIEILKIILDKLDNMIHIFNYVCKYYNENIFYYIFNKYQKLYDHDILLKIMLLSNKINIEIIKPLIFKNKNITPDHLIQCIKGGNPNIFKYLIELINLPVSGCDIPVRNITSSEIIQDNFSGTPGLVLPYDTYYFYLKKCCKFDKNAEIFEFMLLRLLDYAKTIPDEYYNKFLYHACKKNNINIIKVLIEKIDDFDMDRHKTNAFIFSSRYGGIKFVKYMYPYCKDVDRKIVIEMLKQNGHKKNYVMKIKKLYCIE